jgi:hypothetical protein
MPSAVLVIGTDPALLSRSIDEDLSSVRQVTKWSVIDNTINRDLGRNPPLAMLLTHNEARRIAANIAKDAGPRHSLVIVSGLSR